MEGEEAEVSKRAGGEQAVSGGPAPPLGRGAMKTCRGF
jgi:hypothetical protein